MASSDTPRRLSLSAAKAAVASFVFVQPSIAEEESGYHDPVVASEVIRRGVQASQRSAAMSGGLSG